MKVWCIEDFSINLFLKNVKSRIIRNLIMPEFRREERIEKIIDIDNSRSSVLVNVLDIYATSESSGNVQYF
jgi:hypothetical protein